MVLQASDLEGMIPAQVTIRKDNFSVDYNAMREFSAHLLSSGSAGLVLAGSTGEGSLLTLDEREGILESAKYARRDTGLSRPIIMGASASTSREATALIEHAMTHGADGVLVAYEMGYLGPNEAGMSHFFSEVLETGAPIIFYNVPGRQGKRKVPAQVFADLLERYDNGVGVKQADSNPAPIGKYARLARDDFIVLSGDDATVYSLVEGGGRGVISVIGNVAPKLFSEHIGEILGYTQDDFYAGKAPESDDLVAALSELSMHSGNPRTLKVISQRLNEYDASNCVFGPVHPALGQVTLAQQDLISGCVDALVAKYGVDRIR